MFDVTMGCVTSSASYSSGGDVTAAATGLNCAIDVMESSCRGGLTFWPPPPFSDWRKSVAGGGS